MMAGQWWDRFLDCSPGHIPCDSLWWFLAYGVGFMISKEGLTLGPGTRLDHARAFVSVQFSCSVVSNSLWPHELQHARPPCPSPPDGVYPNSRPLSQWCHSTISSSVVPFSSRLQSFPASGSFKMSQFFASGGQRIGESVSASVFPMNI